MDHPDALVMQADHLVDLGRIDDGIAVLERLLARRPEHVGALCALARAQLTAHRPTVARRAAEAALKQAPDSPYARFVYATALTRIGMRGAVPAAQAAVEAAPLDWITYQTLAQALHKAGRTTEALAAARRMVELAPQSANAHAAFADLASDLGEPWTARAAYEAALRLEPEHAHARHNLGTVRAGGSYRSAVGHLFAAATIDPTMAVAQENLRHVVRIGVRLYLTLSFVAAVATWIAGYLGYKITQGVPVAVRVFVALLLAAMLIALALTATTVPRAAWQFVTSTVRRDRRLWSAICCVAAVLVCVGGFAATGAQWWIVLLAVPVAVGYLVNFSLERSAG